MTTTKKTTKKTASKYTMIETQVAQGVGLVWLNRPDVRNAFNEQMIAELTRAFEAFDADDKVRAMVIAARGPAFCAGADLNWMKKMAGYTMAENKADAMGLATMLHTLASMKKPTIARVHGTVYAGGLGLVAACDIAVAATGVEFCVSEAKLGLIPATISPYLIRAMGERMAHRYFLTAERFDASEAYRIGLVQELCAPEEIDGTVNAILGHLVQGSPHAQASCKELVSAVAGRPIDKSLIAESANRIAASRASKDGKEGIRAFLEKRKPAWFPTEGR